MTSKQTISVQKKSDLGTMIDTIIPWTLLYLSSCRPIRGSIRRLFIVLTEMLILHLLMLNGMLIDVMSDSLDTIWCKLEWIDYWNKIPSLLILYDFRSYFFHWPFEIFTYFVRTWLVFHVIQFNHFVSLSLLSMKWRTGMEDKQKWS